MPDIELVDLDGNTVTVPLEHWNRWPQLAQKYRPVPARTTPVVIPVTDVTDTTPTGDKNKEN